jgi:YD repeat-containing protein
LTETFGHDFLGRLVHWVVAQDSKITDWQFEYDDLGNLRSRETVVPLHLTTVTYETYPASQFSYTMVLRRPIHTMDWANALSKIFRTREAIPYRT